MAGAKISIASDTREFSAGIKSGVITPLEDVEQSLQDLDSSSKTAGDRLDTALSNVGTAAKGVVTATGKAEQALDKLGDAAKHLDTAASQSTTRLGRDIADDIKDGTQTAERALDGLEDKLKALQTTSKRSTSGIGDSIGKSIKKGTDEGEKHLESFKEESGSIAREVGTSFDGSAEGILDSFRDLAANAFQDFGPKAAAAGVAISVGLGIAMTALQNLADKINDTGQQTADLAGEIQDAGGRLNRLNLGEKVKDWALEIGDSREWWEIWQDTAKTNLDLVADAADNTGTSIGDMLAAMSGLASDQARAVLDELETKLKNIHDAEAEREKQIRTRIAGPNPYAAEINSLEQAIQKIKEQNGLTDEAIEKQKQLDEALKSSGFDPQLWQARADAVQSITNSLDGAVGGYDRFRDAESGALDPSAYLASIAERSQATLDYAANLQAIQSQLSPEAFQLVMDQGIDFAPMLESIIAGGDQMIDQLNTTFTTAAQSAQSSIDRIDGQIDLNLNTAPFDTQIKAFNPPPVQQPVVPELPSLRDLIPFAARPVRIDLDGNVNPLNSSLTAALAQPKTVTVQPRIDPTQADTQLQQLQTPRPGPTLTPTADTSQAQQAITQAAASAPPSTITVTADTSQASAGIAAVTGAGHTTVITTTADTNQASAAIATVTSAPHETTITATADTSRARRELDDVTEARHDTTITATADTTQAIATLDRAAEDRLARIIANALTANAERDLAYLARDRWATIHVTEVHDVRRIP